MGSGWAAEIAAGLEVGAGEVLIVSPFIKAVALEPLLTSHVGGLRVITRFNLRDFADGVSDIKALRMLIEANAVVRGVSGLHAKLYVFGSVRAIVTSANLTKAGMNSNHEFGLVTDERSVVAECRRYFDELWARAGHDLSMDRLLEWEAKVTRHLAGGGRLTSTNGLEDAGMRIGLDTPSQDQTTAIFDNATQAFVKFFGRGDDRAPLSMGTLEAIKREGCHWALTYPASKRPRKEKDGAVMFIARLVDGGDIRIFGRAIAIAHKPGRDDASADDLSRRPWKEPWPRYIRIHHAEFVAGTLGNGVSLGELMDDLDSNSFASTVRNVVAGHGNTNPHLSFRRQPSVELSPTGHARLRERLETSFMAHGKVSQQALDRLDWPELPTATDARSR